MTARDRTRDIGEFLAPLPTAEPLIAHDEMVRRIEAVRATVAPPGGGVLADTSIRAELAAGALVVDPLGARALQPASVDLHLGDELLVWPAEVRRDPRREQSDVWRAVEVSVAMGGWVLQPGRRYLATTAEWITLPAHLAGQLSARSSWGRDGLAVICGPAGFLDPGYVGRPTLELSVVGSELVLRPGASCLHLILHRLTEPCTRPYAGRYQLDAVPTPSRTHTEDRHE